MAGSATRQQWNSFTNYQPTGGQNQRGDECESAGDFYFAIFTNVNDQPPSANWSKLKHAINAGVSNWFYFANYKIGDTVIANGNGTGPQMFICTAENVGLFPALYPLSWTPQ